MRLWGGKFCLLLSLLLNLFPIKVEACRLLPTPPGNENVFWVHVEGPCLPEEEEALAVRGADLLEALEQGKRIDLDHAVVVDAVMLDLLPLHSLSDDLPIPQPVAKRLEEQGVVTVRLISDALTIRHSRFEKVLATNLTEGALLMLGPVDFTGTIFQQSLDFSKTVFVAPVRFSNMRVDFEGFFIGSQFSQDVDFSHVTFGTHARFHKARFSDRVIFAEANFKGVAEFLEVGFQQEADFSQSAFSGGTGFSGSVFEDTADFSAITADQEMYFRFTEFRESVTFAHAQFYTVVDFTNARFDGAQDFSGAVFRRQPELTGSNIPADIASNQKGLSAYAQVGVFAGLVMGLLWFLWVSKGKRMA